MKEAANLDPSALIFDAPLCRHEKLDDFSKPQPRSARSSARSMRVECYGVNLLELSTLPDMREEHPVFAQADIENERLLGNEERAAIQGKRVHARQFLMVPTNRYLVSEEIRHLVSVRTRDHDDAGRLDQTMRIDWLQHVPLAEYFDQLTILVSE